MVTLVRFRAELIFFFTILLGVEVLLLNIKYDEIDRLMFEWTGALCAQSRRC